MSDPTFDVYLGNPGDAGFNTLVLSGVDVRIPLEADLDGDPHQDDEVRLRSIDGRVERVLFASHADAEEDSARERFVYAFLDVPPGVYSLSVRVSDQAWAPVMSGILITTKDATWQGKSLARDIDAFDPPDRAARRPPEIEAAEGAENGDGCGV